MPRQHLEVTRRTVSSCLRGNQELKRDAGTSASETLVQRLLIFVTAIAATSAVVAAQQPLFKSRVDLVRLDVSVERDGRPVRGLTARDFSIVDNGVRQRINSVALVEEMPLNVVMALDTSGSLFGSRLQSLI